jgi:hypothetical protein
VQRALPLPQPNLLGASVNCNRAALLARRAPAFAILAVGIVLRGLLLNRPGLHPDEALYASWALRIADGSDPALLGVYVDKPPLVLYLLAGLFRLAGFDGSGPPETQGLILAGRLAALLASSASLILLWSIARRVYGPAVALAALALFALSPLAVRLSPTLFTDPWLVLWMLLGVWAALGQRTWLAGIACGLAYATKQQALLLAPLMVAVLWLRVRWPMDAQQAASEDDLAVRPGRALWRWLNGFALVAIAVLWWDSLRWQWMPSYWERSAQTYGGFALSLDAGLYQRLADWIELLGYGFGWPLWLALAGLLVWAWWLRRHRGRDASAALSMTGRDASAALSMTGWGDGEAREARRFDRLLLAVIAGYLLLHIVTSLAAWDRYLLPILPLLALLLARRAVGAWSVVFDPALPASRGGLTGRVAASAVLVGGLVYAGYTATFARLPVGDAGLYDGVQQVAAHVRAAEPQGSVLYHHWLGWHYNFYLYDAPVELRWWQDPADLARKTAVDAGQRQLIAFPAGRGQVEVRAALAAAGLILTPVLSASDASSVALYSIQPVLAEIPDHAR